MVVVSLSPALASHSMKVWYFREMRLFWRVFGFYNCDFTFLDTVVFQNNTSIFSFSMKIYATAMGTQVADVNMKYTLNNDTEIKKRKTNI